MNKKNLLSSRELERILGGNLNPTIPSSPVSNGGGGGGDPISMKCCIPDTETCSICVTFTEPQGSISCPTPGTALQLC